jgi:hypothetical protein
MMRECLSVMIQGRALQLTDGCGRFPVRSDVLEEPSWREVGHEELHETHDAA